MEYQKLGNLLDTKSDAVPRFVSKKWVEVHDQSEKTYNNNKQIRFKTSMLRSDLWDYSDVYIVGKGTITVSTIGDGANNIRDKKNRLLTFNNNVPLIPCISKTNGVLIENAEDLDIVMIMNNLLEYSKNYSKTSGSLWNYCRDELTDDKNDNNGPNKNVINSKYFKYKTSITGNTYTVATIAKDYDANKEG